ncbi:MAG: ABC-2 type transport system permease protein [Gammaproteobacteria bacterium]|jgi:ABC-2 type transport system permease protein
MESGPWYAGRGLTEVVVVGLLQITGIVLLLISPFVTMRLFSDELRSGTIKLLLSSPVSITEIVLGKFLGAMTFLLILIALISFMPFSLIAGTSLDLGLLASGLMALVLLSSVFAAIGLFVSSLSKSPPVSAFSSFMLMFLLWIIHIANDADNEQLQTIANYLSLQKHFNSLLSGAFNSVDVVYYLLLTTFFIVLCIWRLDALRTHQ